MKVSPCPRPIILQMTLAQDEPGHIETHHAAHGPFTGPWVLWSLPYVGSSWYGSNMHIVLCDQCLRCNCDVLAPYEGIRAQKIAQEYYSMLLWTYMGLQLPPDNVSVAKSGHCSASFCV